MLAESSFFKIPDLARDIYTQEYGQAPTAAVVRFMKRDLYHAVLLLLFDQDFQHAYVNGIEVLCGDKASRDLIPRFFSSSNDLMDK
jgi:hypothetical protein